MGPTIDIDMLTERYPLYLLPVRGDFHALGWYVEHDGNHLIFAKSERAVISAFKAVYDKEWASPRAYWRGTVVAPPRSYVEQYARDYYSEAVDQFKIHVEVLVTHDREGRKKESYDEQDANDMAFLRSFHGLRACSYVPPPDFDEPNDPDATPAELAAQEEYEQECRRKHARCANDCHRGVLPAMGSWSDFYEAKGRAFCLARKSCEYIDKRVLREPRLLAVRTDLPAADLSQPLYLVGANFGHHESGLGVRTVDLDALSRHSGKELFFFQGKEVERPAAIKQIIDAAKREEKAHEEQVKVDRKRRDEEERRERKRDIAELFG